METGQVGEYRWLEGKGRQFETVLHRCPQVFVGKCVAISSFDSGPLRPTPEELKRGFRISGELAILACVDQVSDLPWDNYDEWYVFPTDTNPEIREIFVNAPMTLRSAASQLKDYIATSCPQADIVGAKHYFDELTEDQRWFWHEIDRVHPESYIGNGDHLIFLSRNRELFEAALLAFQ